MFLKLLISDDAMKSTTDRASCCLENCVKEVLLSILLSTTASDLKIVRF